MDRFIVHNLFGIEGFDIAWYGVIIGFGMVVAVALAAWRARMQGYKEDLIIDFVLWGIPIGVICARIYYVIFEWEYYGQHLDKIIAIREGGLAIYGGVIGGVTTCIIFCVINKFPIMKMMDLGLPSLILGQIIGRWGNFTNQEAYGNLITDSAKQFFPYAVYIEELGEWHQATFFYESALNLIVFALMMFVIFKVKPKRDGWMLPMYLCGYGLVRVFVEGMRADSLYIAPGIRVSQLLSAILIMIGLVFAWMIRNNKIPEKKYEGKYLADASLEGQE